MTEFGDFYARGGVFMHVVSLLSLVAAGMLTARAASLRKLARRRVPDRPGPDDGVIRALVSTAVVAGVLGTVLGMIEMCTALQSVPPQHTSAALLRAIPVALTPLAWALMLAAPLVLGRASVSAVESRLVALKRANR